jgi:WD40 repeat protein
VGDERVGFGLRLWDAGTGQPVGQPVTGNKNIVWSVAFSPDGKRIVSGGDDTFVRMWLAYADAAAVCAKLTTNISHQQWRDWVSPDIGYVEVCPGLQSQPVVEIERSGIHGEHDPAGDGRVAPDLRHP